MKEVKYTDEQVLIIYITGHNTLFTSRDNPCTEWLIYVQGKAEILRRQFAGPDDLL